MSKEDFLCNHIGKIIGGFFLSMLLFINYCTPIPSNPDSVTVNDNVVTVVRRVKTKGGLFYNEVLMTNHFYIYKQP